MTGDFELREPAQRALGFIVASQHETRGGWRYEPQVSSDNSVTVWMMAALKTGELAGLNVPAETFRKIDTWLDLAQASQTERHLYRYNPLAPDSVAQRHGRLPSPSMTAAGLLMRLHRGWKADNPDLINGAKYLQANLPAIGTPRQPARDSYYWYYGTQVMYQVGGEHWNEWSRRLYPLLVETQQKDHSLAGSWDPRRPVPDRWAPYAGRIYVTAMNLLSLEVPYRVLRRDED
jgi:hypothetical protein